MQSNGGHGGGRGRVGGGALGLRDGLAHMMLRCFTADVNSEQQARTSSDTGAHVGTLSPIHSSTCQTAQAYTWSMSRVNAGKLRRGRKSAKRMIWKKLGLKN